MAKKNLSPLGRVIAEMLSGRKPAEISERQLDELEAELRAERKAKMEASIREGKSRRAEMEALIRRVQLTKPTKER